MAEKTYWGRCTRFHKDHLFPYKGGYAGGDPYLQLRGGPTDGLGTIHGHLYGRCARCDRLVAFANVHLSADPDKAAEIIKRQGERINELTYELHNLRALLREGEA